MSSICTKMILFLLILATIIAFAEADVSSKSQRYTKKRNNDAHGQASRKLVIPPTNTKPVSCPDESSSPLLLNITITTDQYPQETSWKLINECTQVPTLKLSSNKGEYNLTTSTYNHFICVPTIGKYTFTIHDARGDGLCCTYGDGSYSVTLNGEMKASGDTFDYIESNTFGSCTTDDEDINKVGDDEETIILCEEDKDATFFYAAATTTEKNNKSYTCQQLQEDFGKVERNKACLEEISYQGTPAKYICHKTCEKQSRIVHYNKIKSCAWLEHKPEKKRKKICDGNPVVKETCFTACESPCVSTI